jgi:hypothetical protein
MAEQREERTIIVKAKGRKWWTGVMGSVKTAQLLLDEVTEGIAPDSIVRFVVAEDLSVRSGYGTALKFRAAEVVSVEPAGPARERAAARREAEKWLGYAEADVTSGRARTRAVGEAMDRCRSVPELAERLDALVAEVQRVRAGEPQREAEKWLGYAEADAGGGQTRTNAIRRALATDVGVFPALADRVEALRALVARNARENEAAQEKTTVLASAPPLGVVARWPGYGANRPLVVWTRVVGSHRIGESDPAKYGAILLGHEGEVGVKVAWREATEAEVAEWEAAEEEKTARRKAEADRQKEIAALHREIRAAGQAPDGWNEPAGDVLLDTFTVYGGGERFVLDREGGWLWSIQNNGADGDNWAYNNVVTGGAGAIGWRVEARADLVEQLERLVG